MPGRPVSKIDSGNISALVLLDLSAVFDTVDHSIMLQVLRDRFCVEGRALEWFESYLCDRTQTYQVKDQQSRPRKVDCGVPQGSVLGPQKFIAYTEDLAELIDEHCLNHHMYADDTQMIEQTTIPGIPGTIMKLQSCIEATQEWCKSRRLQLNPAKTELIWFGSKANLKKIADLDLNLYIGADVIKPVSVVRDLGVFLDSELSMRHHVNTVVPVVFFIFGVWKQFDAYSVQRLPQAWCQPSWQPGLTTVTQISQAFHNLRLIHFNVFKMRRPDLLQEQERGTTSLQSSRACTGFRSSSALFTSFACSCTWCELVAVLRTCRTWWHPWLTCLVVRDWDPPAASDMNFHSWN